MGGAILNSAFIFLLHNQFTSPRYLRHMKRLFVFALLLATTVSAQQLTDVASAVRGSRRATSSTNANSRSRDSLADICTITGKSEPAVKALLRRAIAALARAGHGPGTAKEADAADDDAGDYRQLRSRDKRRSDHRRTRAQQRMSEPDYDPHDF